MERIEKYLALGCFGVFALNLLNVPAMAALFVMLMSLFAIFYFYCSLFLLNEIPFKGIFNKESYKGWGFLRIILSFFGGIFISITLIGLMFHIQYWPGSTVLLSLGLILLASVLIVAQMKLRSSDSVFWSGLRRRAVVFLLVAGSVLALPHATWVEIKYRSHPEYVAAFKDALQDFDNQELWDRVEEEKFKIR